MKYDRNNPGMLVVADALRPEPTDDSFEEAMRGLAVYEGSISEEEAEYLAATARQLDAKHIAQTGLGRGRSAWAFLAAVPDCHVTTFDIGDHHAVPGIHKVLYERFGGRHTLIVGDSKITVPRFRRDEWELVFIDGGHDYETAVADLRNFARRGRVVVFDDVHTGADPARAWNDCNETLIQPTDDVDRERHAWAAGIYR